ncbi:MAG: hypothetical protein ABL903_17450 [Methylococcales bacterium]
MLDYLLAGPILRRATAEVVCVWIAADRAVNFKLMVYDGDVLLGENDPKTTVPSEGQQLGKHLFIYLLQAHPILKDSFFPLDTVLSYRIECNDKALDFKSINLTYAGAAHPSFFIPSQLTHLLHGSCRKPHGNAKDALSFGDAELADTYNDLDKRPALLLLTGDQIYADDVAHSILSLLMEKALILLGYQELLPWEDLPESRFNRFMENLRGLFGKKSPPVTPVGQLFVPTLLASRENVARKQAGFSSTEADNHLFTFGEYAAMYLYVLGNAGNWQPDFSSESGARREALDSFHETLPKVRRLFANIPTYMIFDDHDVTDDWNITGAWYYKVRGLDLGQRVVANALASYWAFQGWGNAPQNFDATFTEAITNYLAASPSASFKVTDRYELTTWKHHSWGYSVPTNPPVIVMDSRTQRQPDGAYYPPQLLDRYALDWLRVEWAMLTANIEQDVDNGELNLVSCWPIFVATTPVMGFAPIERVQQFLLWAIGSIEDTFWVRWFEKMFGLEGKATVLIIRQFDAEAWISNREGFAKFLKCLLHRMHIPQCVFLSGDVHYSFTTAADFKNENKTLNCLQLTSSALCNTPSAKNKFNIINDIVNKKHGVFEHSNYGLNPEQCWQSNGKYLTIEGNSHQQRITPKCNIGLVVLQNGRPAKHCLLNGEEPEVFLL